MKLYEELWLKLSESGMLVGEDIENCPDNNMHLSFVF